MNGKINIGGGGANKGGIVFKAVNDEGYPTKIIYKFPFSIPSGLLNSNLSHTSHLNKYCEEITVEGNFAGTGTTMEYWLHHFVGKLKMKTNLIPKKFCQMAKGTNETVPESKQKKAVWIAKTVETIATGGNGYNSNNPFYGSEGVTIYCEATEKQPGWELYWNSASTDSDVNLKLTVVYGVTEEQFDAL